VRTPVGRRPDCGAAFERVVGGDVPTAQRRQRRRIDVRHPDGVVVGPRHRHSLGERAGGARLEAQRSPVRTGVAVADLTVAAGPAAEGERHRDAVALGQRRHVGAGGDDPAGGVVAQHETEGRPIVGQLAWPFQARQSLRRILQASTATTTPWSGQSGGPTASIDSGSSYSRRTGARTAGVRTDRV